MIKSLNFGEKLNINTIARADHPLLRQSRALSGQPLCDEVAFGSLNPEKCKKILIENYHPPTIAIKQIKPIEIQQKQNGVLAPVKAFLAETERLGEDDCPVSGFAIFSKEGKLLGDIPNLYTNHFIDFIEEKNTFPEVEKYLFIKKLYASYENGYKGVGTALVDAAIEKSKELGLDGQIGLKAYNNYNFEAKGSPIPFYAKLGFVPLQNPSMTKEEIIEQHKGQNPCVTMFKLTQENLEKLKELKSRPKVESPEEKPNITMRLLRSLFGNFV